MSTAYLRTITLACLGLAAVTALQAILGMPPAAAQGTEEATVSTAEEHYRSGMTSYINELFEEALGYFTRAYALDETFEEARMMRNKTDALIAQRAAGQAPGAARFETFDPGEITPGETPVLSADEIKRERVKTLLNNAKRYYENAWYGTALEIYEQVLRIDPTNRIAEEGLHNATLKVGEKRIQDAVSRKAEDIARIRAVTEERKLLDDDMDAMGIKTMRISTPQIEEEYEQVITLSHIEQALQSSISITFDNMHISEIVQIFIEDYDLNIQIDWRAVQEKRDEEAIDAAAQLGFGGGGFGGYGGGGF